MAGDNKKHATWALLLSLISLITTFQQLMAVLYNWRCQTKLSAFLPWLSTERSAIIVPGLFLVLGYSQQKQFTWCWDRPTSLLGRSLLQAQVQPFACKPNTENIWRQDYPPSRLFLMLGSSSIHVNSPLNKVMADFFVVVFPRQFIQNRRKNFHGVTWLRFLNPIQTGKGFWIPDEKVE